MSTATSPILKVAVLGDANIGKSNLVTTYISNYYTGAYVPTVEEIYTKALTLIHNDGERSLIQLVILDLGGSEEYDRLRLLALGVQGPVDVFILCFKTGGDESLGSVVTRWKDIVDYVGGGAPVVLAGLMADEVSFRVNCSEAAVIVGASAYLGCSSLKKWGVKEVFEKAVALGFEQREEKLIGGILEKLQKKGRGGKGRRSKRDAEKLKT